MHKEVRASMEQQLAEGVWFGATTDLRTNYLATKWQLTHCLETLYFPKDHRAEHITEMMENMLLDWKIKTVWNNNRQSK